MSTDAPGNATPFRSRWDYRKSPVKAHDPGAIAGNFWQGWAGDGAPRAFDGAGGSDTHPLYGSFLWQHDGRPSEAHPFVCTVDYGQPVAVAKFVHTFPQPGGLDNRFGADFVPSPFLALDVDISDDGDDWRPLQQFRTGDTACPQTFLIDTPVAARYYRLSVLRLPDAAVALRSYEIETYTGTIIGAVVLPPTWRQGEASGLAVEVRGAADGAGLSIAGEFIADGGEVVALGECPVQGAGRAVVRPDWVLPLAGPGTLALTLTDGGEVLDGWRRAIWVEPQVEVTSLSANAGRRGPTGTTVHVKGTVRVTGDAPLPARFSALGETRDLGTLPPGAATPVAMDITTTDAGAIPIPIVAETADGAYRRAFRRAVSIPYGPAEATLTGADATVGLRTDELATHLDFGGAQADLQWLVDNRPLAVVMAKSSDGVALWYGDTEDALVEIEAQAAPLGCRFTVRLLPKEPLQPDAPTHRVEARLRVHDPRVWHVPAYLWRDEPTRTLDLMPGYMGGDFLGRRHGEPWLYGPTTMMLEAHYLPTRLAAIETAGGVVGLVPDHDRCLLGVLENDLDVRFPALRANEPCAFTVTCVGGDWFAHYRAVVDGLFAFASPRQYHALSEILDASMGWALDDRFWNDELGALRAFPDRDWYLVLYGVPYTVPLLQAWAAATGDATAAERAGRIVKWLTAVPRAKSGPSSGGYYSQWQKPKPGDDSDGGYDQAGNRWLTMQATGAALMALLAHWQANAAADGGLPQTLRAGCDWLLARQHADGGWGYAYDLDGTEHGPQQGSSGCIWNIWALYRMGQLTGEAKYRDAAKRARDWYVRTYAHEHIYRGFWEDVSGYIGHVTRSVGGYDAAIAVLAFLDMGEPETALSIGRDVVQWVCTRQLDNRDYEVCYGQVPEQWGWQPAAYCTPAVSYACWRLFEATGDAFWAKFGHAIRNTGWWRDANDRYGPIWIYQPADLTMPFEREYILFTEPPWSDWQGTQQNWYIWQWLIAQANHLSGGRIQADPETGEGQVDGHPVRIALMGDALSVSSPDGQVNWLGYAGGADRWLVCMNHGSEPSQAIVTPRTPGVHDAMRRRLEAWLLPAASPGWLVGGNPWDGAAVRVALAAGEAVLLHWQMPTGGGAKP